MWKPSASWTKRSSRRSCWLPLLSSVANADATMGLGVQAPNDSRPPNQVPVHGEADEEDMDVENERKRIRGCIENDDDPLEAPEIASSANRRTVEALFPKAKQNIFFGLLCLLA
eukprot:2775364-Amphidinium_carterae.1